jgi:hypothetical protein
MKLVNTCIYLLYNGAEGQNRTADTVIFSHVLYQLSYLGTDGHAERKQTPNHINSTPLAPPRICQAAMLGRRDRVPSSGVWTRATPLEGKRQGTDA